MLNNQFYISQTTLSILGKFTSMFNLAIGYLKVTIYCWYICVYIYLHHAEDNLFVSPCETFSNREVATSLFLCLMVTDCSEELLFSQLKRMKNELRTTMLQQRLSNLSIMSIKSNILKKMDFEVIAENFAQQKSRKKPLTST